MRKGIAIFAVTAVCAVTAAGCAKSPASADIRAGFVVCTEPRPEACTMQYDPVCGEMTDGRSNTYSNASKLVKMNLFLEFMVYSVSLLWFEHGA